MRYFYIDTENVNDSAWAPDLPNLKRTDVLILFNSSNSNKMSIGFADKLSACLAEVRVINVKSGTKNAMDFVLVAALSSQISTAKRSEHIIISNDKGYTPVIDFFLKKNINIRQQSSLQ